jgi:hypothetical protein
VDASEGRYDGSGCNAPWCIFLIDYSNTLTSLRMPLTPIISCILEARNEVRLLLRAGQSQATINNYLKSAESDKISRKDHIQGWYINHAQYEEADLFAESYMREKNMHLLGFNEKANHYVRGQLIDTLEVDFAFFTSLPHSSRSFPPCATSLRSSSLSSTSNRLANAPVMRTTVQHPLRRRRRVTRARSPRRRASFCTVVLSLLGWSLVEYVVLSLRDLVRDGKDVIDGNFNPNSE